MNCHRFAAVSSGCLFLLLNACSVGPAYKRPDIALPSNWHDSTGPDAATVWPAADWWTNFKAEFGTTMLPAITSMLKDGASILRSISTYQSD